MQYGGRGEVMHLETVILQEPGEEWMDWESKAPQQVRDKAYSLPWMGWGNSPLAPRRRKWLIRLGRDKICRWEKPLGLQLHQLAVGYDTLLPIARLGVARAGGRAASAGHVGVDFSGML